MTATDDEVIASWRDRVGTLRKRGRVSAASLTVVPADEIDVRRGRPPAPERLSDEERALWDKLTFSRRPGWFSGAESLLESYVVTVSQVQGLEAALQGKAGRERSLPEAGATPPTVGRSGGHTGDAVAADAVIEARQKPAHGWRAAGGLTKEKAPYVEAEEATFLGVRGNGISMENDPDLGWTSDHVGMLERLRDAVRILAEGHKNFDERIDKATYALVHFRPKDFPAHLRPRIQRIHLARRRAAMHWRAVMHWRAADTGREVPIIRFSFAYLTPTERHNLVADIIGLYEACLIDIGRTWPRWDFVYPQKDDVAHTQKRKKRHREETKAG